MIDLNKVYKIAVVALVFAFLGWFLPQQADVSFETVGNDTDLCNFNHTSGRCNGVRNASVIYHANESSIYISIKAHGNAANQNVNISLFRNGVEIAHDAKRPLAVPENIWGTAYGIIDKGDNYSFTVEGYHHYEVYETYFLSGKNGTLSINQNITNTTQNILNGTTNHHNLTNKSLSDHNTTSNLSLYGFYLVNTSLKGNSTQTINIGDNYEYSDDAVINVRRDVDDTSTIIHAHTFADNSVATRNITTNGGLGYNSFDSLPTIDSRMNHYAGYQARPNLISFNGTNLTTFYGFYTFPVVSKYNITTSYAYKVFNPAFTNNSNIINSYGLYIENQTNTTNFYPLVAGNGNIGLGTFSPSSQIEVRSTKSNGYLTPQMTLYDDRGILRTRLYEAGLQQWFMNNSGIEAGLISFGFPGGNPGIAILNGSLGNRQDVSIDAVNGGWLFGTGTTSAAPPNSIWMNASGDVSLLKVGGGLKISEGTNAKMGVCTLVVGFCAVSTTAVTANSRIFLTPQSPGGTPGWVRVSARTPGTSFSITSSSGSDTSIIAWIIIEPR